MAEERLFDAKQGAYMTRMALASFRTRVSKLKIKGQRDGRKVLYTRKQLETIYAGIPARAIKTAKARKTGKARKATKKRVKKVAKRRA